MRSADLFIHPEAIANPVTLVVTRGASPPPLQQRRYVPVLGRFELRGRLGAQPRRHTLCLCIVCLRWRKTQSQASISAGLTCSNQARSRV